MVKAKEKKTAKAQHFEATKIKLNGIFNDLMQAVKDFFKYVFQSDRADRSSDLDQGIKLFMFYK